MSSALTVIVLGHAFFGDLSVPNTSPIQHNCAEAPSSTQAHSTTGIPNIIQLLTEPTIPTAKREARRPDYTYTPGVGAHKLITEQVDWNTARQKCERDGAHLVVINSVAEAVAVAGLVESTYTRASHVGVHDLNHEGQFTTIHGEAVIRTGFAKWNAGEPNNNWGDFENTPENCVEIRFNVKLNDIPCTNYRSNFVCELRL